MTEDAGTKPSEESVGAASAMRQRKKRRWDEPADFLISTGISIPGAIPIGFGNSLGISTPGVLPVSNAIATNTLVPLITHSATTLVQKLSQSKVQDELIAREIVINDAEPTIRYKLTKRQTQEEIQRSTGAIVITRGKYRPPNALPDNEKPLYLHISAGSHLKDMAERIIAVDRAASMVEEILRQGHNLLSNSCSHSAGQVNQPMSICLFLGFEPDPSQNIAARIRGPNLEAGRGWKERGTWRLAGRADGLRKRKGGWLPPGDFLDTENMSHSSHAHVMVQLVAFVIWVPSSKVYRAVPPPHQLLAGVVSSANADPVVSSSCAVAGVTQAGQSLASSTSAVSSLSTVLPSGVLIPNGNLASCGTSIPNTGNYVYPTVTGGTCYSGYGGIYPQATPLQQVALALKQAPLSSTSVVSSAASNANALPKMTSSSNADREKRPSQKRKFQELPVTSKGLSTLNQPMAPLPTSSNTIGVSQNSRQGSECFKPGLEDAAGKIPFMPPTKKSSQPALGELPPPPPPRMMPPPPPKFSSDHNRNSIAAPPPPNFPSSDSPVGFQNQNPAMSPAVTETLVQSIVSEKASLEPASGDHILKSAPPT
ncbi:Protein RIK [Dendrobium catenatum]|uniref:Protein RIK n=1 Tax=Dendrobium catenatum TaxID=906689 RepID=A0A2I0W8V7_9ASPA|nr:Protein RIK [Dendrobium catenatum]